MDTEALPGILRDPGANTPERGPPETSGGALQAMRKAEATGADPFGLVTEAEAYRIYGHLLEDKELRRARAAGRIGYLRRKRIIHYRRDELDTFVRALIEQGYVEPWQPKPTTPARTLAASPSPHPSTEATCRRVLARLSQRAPR